MKQFSENSGLSGLYYAAILLVIVFIAGVTGYSVIEGYSLLDSVYMVVITFATVGFDEVHPLSDPGKYFTILLILSSFGIVGYVITTITRFMVDGGFKKYYLHKKVNKMISHTNDHVIICGYGRNGSQACRELIQHNQSFLVIESKESVISRMEEDDIKLFILGDATQDSVLERAGVSKAKALITTLPSDADNTFVVLTARHMNPDLIIISRASGNYSDLKLKRAGANNVIMPDKIGGTQMAKLVIQPDVVEFMDNILLHDGKHVQLEEIRGNEIHASFHGESIENLLTKTNSQAAVLGIKTANGDYLYNPSPEVTFTVNDKLFVLGTPEQISKLRD